LEKLRKATIAFVTSVCPSVRIQQLSYNWKDVMKFVYVFEKSSKKLKFFKNLSSTTDTSHEEQ